MGIARLKVIEEPAALGPKITLISGYHGTRAGIIFLILATLELPIALVASDVPFLIRPSGKLLRRCWYAALSLLDVPDFALSVTFVAGGQTDISLGSEFRFAAPWT